jgi:hypothetical protein
MSTKTRQLKTPQQRAREAYDVAARTVERIEKRLKAAQAQVDEVKAEHAAAVARRDYAAGHPDLVADEPLPFAGGGDA